MQDFSRLLQRIGAHSTWLQGASAPLLVVAILAMMV